MGHVRLTAHVKAPIEMVFDYAIDYHRAAEWNVSLVEMTADRPFTKVGDTFHGTSKFLGRLYKGEGEITEFERPRRVAFVSKSPEGGSQKWLTTLTPVGSETEIVTEIEYEVPMGLIGAVADKVFLEREVQRTFEQSRDNFIALVEHEVLVPA